jgi:hypothetical protein
MNTKHKSFLDQFAAARKEIEELPPSMKESVRWATLTFPPTKPAAPLPRQEASKKKD